MTNSSFYLGVSCIEVALSLVTFVLLLRARSVWVNWPMLVLTMWQVVPYFTLVALKHFRYFSAQHAYAIYYFTYWIMYALEAVCAIALTYTILHAAMRPLKGLQSLVKIVYFWAAGISVIIAMNVSLQPEADLYQRIQNLVVQLQRATGIMSCSLILFVCIAIQPMGLSLRSRIMGTSLGLFMISTSNVVAANFLMAEHRLYNKYSLAQSVTSCAANLLWIYYFAVPEPQRRFILLPTTSPFHRWNQISELLGHDPGYVAIGGIPPEAFAAAEIEIFHRASAKMNALGEPMEPPAPSRLEK